MPSAKELIEQVISENADDDKVTQLAKKYGGSGSSKDGWGKFKFPDEGSAGKFLKALDGLKTSKDIMSQDDASDYKKILTEPYSED